MGRAGPPSVRMDSAAQAHLFGVVLFGATAFLFLRLTWRGYRTGRTVMRWGTEVTRATQPIFYWVSLACWAVSGFVSVWVLIKFATAFLLSRPTA